MRGAQNQARYDDDEAKRQETQDMIDQNDDAELQKQQPERVMGGPQ